MKLTDFFEQVEKDEALRGVDVVLGDTPDEDCVVIEDVLEHSMVRMLAKTVRSHDWEVLREVALGRRDCQPLYHVTRIVGYFSRVENWNKSKLGELADRRQGDYRIQPGQVSEDLPELSVSA